MDLQPAPQMAWRAAPVNNETNLRRKNATAFAASRSGAATAMPQRTGEASGAENLIAQN
jgi:hypothetical protein